MTKFVYEIELIPNNCYVNPFRFRKTVIVIDIFNLGIMRNFAIDGVYDEINKIYYPPSSIYKIKFLEELTENK